MRTIVINFLAMLIFTMPAYSQNTGTISGKVVNNQNKPLTGINVKLKGEGHGDATNAEGKFTITNVPPGEYNLEASAVNYSTKSRQVTVNANQTTKIEFSLAFKMGELSTVEIKGNKRKTASATRTLTPLDELPMSIQILDNKVMEQQQIIDIDDAVKNVSGVVKTSSYNGGYSYYNSRGFDMNNWSNFRRNGMFLWNMGGHYGDYIDQVEFLKGPAAILYGDVAPGGVMNFKTKDPLPYNYARIKMQIGQYGLYRPSVDVGGPIDKEGNLMYRMNAAYETSGSFKDQVNSETYIFAPAITWNISPDINWTLEGTIKDDERTSDPGVISPDGTFDGLSKIEPSTFLGEPGSDYNYINQSAYSEFTYEITNFLRFDNTLYYANTVRKPENIYISGSEPINDQGGVERTQYYYKQVFRGWGAIANFVGDFKTGPVNHELMLGMDHTVNNQRTNNVLNRSLDTTINLFEPNYGVAEVRKNTSTWENNYNYNKRTGYYLKDQASMFDDKLHLLAGVRYNVSQQGQVYSHAQGEGPTDQVFTLQDFWAPNKRTATDESQENNHIESNPLSPRVGVVYKPISQISLYGSYSTSFENNGTDWIDQDYVVKPTKARQFEFGVKSNLMDDKLGASLTAFRIDKDNVYGFVQTNTKPSFDYIGFQKYGSTGYATYSGAEHASQGIELDINGNPISELYVNASGAYIDAFVVDDPGFETGNQLSNQPKFSGSLWTNYTFEDSKLEGLQLGYGAFYRGEFFLTNKNDPAKKVEPSFTMDASVGYSFNGYTARLNVKNLTNEINYLGGARGQYEIQWPRRVMLSVSKEF